MTGMVFLWIITIWIFGLLSPLAPSSTLAALKEGVYRVGFATGTVGEAGMAAYTWTDVQELAQVMRYEAEQKRPFAMLTGAGCSLAAGIPLAGGILDLIPPHSSQAMCSKLGVQKLEAEDYGRAMGLLTLTERRDILGPLLKDAKVNWGHLALACLMKAGMVGRVLTFNFDSVLARASGICGLYPAIYDFGVSPAETFDHLVNPCIVHLHGQGYGLAMMNSEDETKNHAKNLKPLFDDTLLFRNVICIGYSGAADKAFPHIVTAASNRMRLYWCNFSDTEPQQHVSELLHAAGNTATYLGGVDFDRFMVELARELKCFPPTVLSRPAQHLLDEIFPITPPPENVEGVDSILPGLRARLEALQGDDSAGVSNQVEEAMLKGDWDAVIGLAPEISSDSDRKKLYWAHVMKGNALLELAKLKQDEHLFRESIGKYEAALKIKPDKHEALNNWGNALSGLAQLKQDEYLFRESIGKYEAALKIKPDDHEKQNNWGNALLALARLKQDEHLFRESIGKYEAALKIKPDYHEALNNWGNTLSGLAQLKQNEGLFQESFGKYEAALKIKPDYHEALNNWGNTLLELAKLKQDEHLFRESIGKYEAALKIKPDKHETLDNWSAALIHLYHLTGKKAILAEAERKAEAVERISGKPVYNTACVLALRGDSEACRTQLEKCKAAGTLPKNAKKHLLEDVDMAAYHSAPWFLEFVNGLGEGS
jgi:tetratricopeptide (TPR) repeat protein